MIALVARAPRLLDIDEVLRMKKCKAIVSCDSGDPNARYNAAVRELTPSLSTLEINFAEGGVIVSAVKRKKPFSSVSTVSSKDRDTLTTRRQVSKIFTVSESFTSFQRSRQLPCKLGPGWSLRSSRTWSWPCHDPCWVSSSRRRPHRFLALCKTRCNQ